jgi:hypothetical protein
MPVIGCGTLDAGPIAVGLRFLVAANITLLYQHGQAARKFCFPTVGLPINPASGLLGYGDDLEGSGSAEDLFKTLQAYKVSYLVKFPIFAFDQDRIDGVISEVQKKYPGSLKQVYLYHDKRFEIYELVRQN